MKLDGAIVQGERAGQVALGTSLSTCVELLGAAAQTARYENNTFLTWTSLGFGATFNGRSSATHLFCFYTLDELRLELKAGRELGARKMNPKHELACCGLSTARGITARSREADVRDSYGAPTKAFGGEADGWSRLEYPGIDFRFVKGRLARISIRRIRKKR